MVEKISVGSFYGEPAMVDQDGLRGEHRGGISSTKQGSQSRGHIDQLSWETRSRGFLTFGFTVSEKWTWEEDQQFGRAAEKA